VKVSATRALRANWLKSDGNSDVLPTLERGCRREIPRLAASRKCWPEPFARRGNRLAGSGNHARRIKGMGRRQLQRPNHESPVRHW